MSINSLEGEKFLIETKRLIYENAFSLEETLEMGYLF